MERTAYEIERTGDRSHADIVADVEGFFALPYFEVVVAVANVTCETGRSDESQGRVA